MAMVRRGVMFSFREASCCMVEVVKGGDGERRLSVRFTLDTAKGVSWSWARMSSTSCWEAGSYFLPPRP